MAVAMAEGDGAAMMVVVGIDSTSRNALMKRRIWRRFFYAMTLALKRIEAVVLGRLRRSSR